MECFRRFGSIELEDIAEENSQICKFEMILKVSMKVNAKLKTLKDLTSQLTVCEVNLLSTLRLFQN